MRGRRRNRAWAPASQRSTIWRVFNSRCHRSATWMALEAVAPPFAYSLERSRTMISISGWRRSQAENVDALWSGKSSIGFRRSRSIRMES